MSTISLRPFAIGAAIGLPIAAVLFFTVPAYHNFILWQYSQPWLLLPAAFAGFYIAWLTDK